MKKESINSLAELKTGLQKNPKSFLLLYKKGSEQSDCAFERIQKIQQEDSSIVYMANVNEVKDIHSVYNIKTAPSLLEFENGALKNIYKGCHSEDYYTAAITGTGFSSATSVDGKKVKRVTVYTTPTCSYCNTIKTYLNENGIHYTEVDVASNPSKAEEMVRRSGQQGVPQTNIEGEVVVGFDKKRINELLEIN